MGVFVSERVSFISFLITKQGAQFNNLNRTRTGGRSQTRHKINLRCRDGLIKR